MSFQVGDVVKYSTGEWCRHGLAIIKESTNGQLFACDTYWSSMDSHVPIENLSGMPVVGNINTFMNRTPYPYEYDDYRESDRFYIPVGGGSAQYYVRKEAEPDPEKVAERLRYALQKAHDKVTSAAKDVEWQTKELLKFELKQGAYAPKTVQKMDTEKPNDL